MDSKLLTVSAKYNYNLYDTSCRKQTQKYMGDWTDEPTPMVSVDNCNMYLGVATNESDFMGCVHKEPSRVEQVEFEKAIWNAYLQCFIYFDEAEESIALYKCGLL